MNPIPLGTRTIGSDHPPFVIAEMAGNHNQSLERALAIVDAAAASGVDAVKLQTYTADTLTIDCGTSDFVINDPQSLWNGRTLYDLYNEAHTPWEWHAALFARCREHGVVGFSTPFDATAVDFLESLHVPLYKLASFENGDLALIQKIAATKKPLIASIGMARVDDVAELVNTARTAGARDIVLLKCTSTYPASPRDSHLRTIPDLREKFSVWPGLSDHTPGIGAAIASVALGATVIEKHFTLSRSEGGVDAAFSLEPAEMQQLVMECRRAWEALGDVRYGAGESERGSLQFRRSLYVVRDMQAGEIFTTENVRCIRPGYGLAPKLFDEIIGKRSKQALARGTALRKEFVD